MPDRDLTPEEYDFINTALDVVAQSDPAGPNAEEDRMYCSLLDMGCTAQWIAEQIEKRAVGWGSAVYEVVEVTPDDYGF